MEIGRCSKLVLIWVSVTWIWPQKSNILEVISFLNPVTIAELTIMTAILIATATIAIRTMILVNVASLEKASRLAMKYDKFK